MNGSAKAIILGTLGKDPELRYTPAGTAVATFSVAVNKVYKEKKTTEWVNLVAWGKTGELASEYLHKGSKVYIEGEITTRSWDDKDGKKCYKTEIVVREMQFIDSPKKDQPQDDSQFPVDDLPY